MNEPPASAPETPKHTPTPEALRMPLRTAVILLLFTLAFTLLMAAVHDITGPLITATQQEAKQRLINQLLPAADHDNDLLNDAVLLPAVAELGLEAGTMVRRARKLGKPTALVFETTAADGYAGRIDLIIALRADGRIAAVRVTQHRETPGLGDYIDKRKDRNKAQPWIDQFAGASLAAIPAARWTVKKDGGDFDQRAGATISARAVTRAVGRAVAWAQPRMATLFALPTGAQYGDQP